MNDNQNLSLSDMVLVAAVKLAAGNVAAEFTAENLVVAVWSRDNASFGLRGHETKYPDNNKVYTKIDGKSGLVSKGLLTKAGERTLRVQRPDGARCRRSDRRRGQDGKNRRGWF